MRNPVPDYLHEILDSLRDDRAGAVADYIPQLADADPDVLGVALTIPNGRTYSVGDDRVEFSIQSISKPFAYAAALIDRGVDAVEATVGVEPSGEAFDELSLEGGTHRPKNPMINAGALAVHHLLAGDGATAQDRVTRIVGFLSELAGRVLTVDEEVYRSEIETADRNLAIVHMLRNYGVVSDSAHAVVDGYTRQCAVRVTVRDLAVMGATLANAGVQPVTGNRVVPAAVARRTLAVMAGCGMYDAAGDWLVRVGIPAKSGVAGGLMGALPGQLGLGTVSPRLDTHGNSVRGVAICERLSRDMGMHLMEAEPHGNTAVRGATVEGDTTVYEIQGAIHFPGADAILDRLSGDAISTSTVTLDLTRVDRFSDVGRRMVLEALRRLTVDGHTTTLVDPDTVLPDPDLGDGTYPVVRTER
ncbi:glutaminase [Pseudonocardia sp. MH-G8]|uniref:glutaminase n=1 Tax=Pseudonocardia sp. MH-G8 TaxID=1854588 RepID=UPI000BA13FD9|nr:glutaminase [Pseudonocardia sp. MH-G8]OZM83146.1 glutaminase A [Pseudonocardia sp. MH-G8]